MSLKTQSAGVPQAALIEASQDARVRVSSGSGKKPPLPVLTSNTIPDAPSASFFDRMLPTTSGIELTVEVRSLRPYRRLSAGAIPAVAMPIAMPKRSSRPRVLPRSNSNRTPGMLSSLSAVPPLWPRERPVSLAAGTPHEASTGSAIRLTVSPTPPVECLSTSGPKSAASAHRSPDSSIARVNSRVSSESRPRIAAAIRKAARCTSVQLPSAAPATTDHTSSRVSVRP